MEAFRGKNVLNIPRGKLRYISMNIYDELGSLVVKAVMPDEVVGDGLFGRMDGDTFMTTEAAPSIIQPKQAVWAGGVRFMYFSSMSDFHRSVVFPACGVTSEGTGYLHRDGSDVRFLVGRNAEDLVAVPFNATFESSASFAAVDTDLQATLEDMGFSAVDAQILSRGVCLVMSDSHLYLMFSDYVHDPFCWDVSKNGQRQQLSTYWPANVPAGGAVIGSTSASSYDSSMNIASKMYNNRHYRIEQVPRVTLAVAITNNTTWFRSAVFIPTTMVTETLANAQARQQFLSTMNTDVLEQLLDFGVPSAQANTLAHGAAVYGTIGSANTNNLQLHTFAPVSFSETSFKLILYQGDYAYLTAQAQ